MRAGQMLPKEVAAEGPGCGRDGGEGCGRNTCLAPRLTSASSGVVARCVHAAVHSNEQAPQEPLQPPCQKGCPNGCPYAVPLSAGHGSCFLPFSVARPPPPSASLCLLGARPVSLPGTLAMCLHATQSPPLVAPVSTTGAGGAGFESGDAVRGAGGGRGLGPLVAPLGPH